MIIEISIYLAIIAFCIPYRHILSGRKNGCFYHKNDNPLPPFLEREITNIHFIETPAWYVLHIVAFFAMYIPQRITNPTFDWSVLIQIGISLLFMAGTYMIPSYHFQRGITAGLKDDEHLDAITDSEVAIMIFGIKIQFWKGRFFNNKRRKLAQWIGILLVLLSISLLFIFMS